MGAAAALLAQASCSSHFELIYPSSNNRLQGLYDLLLSTSQRAHAEACGARNVPPMLSGEASEWIAMLKVARTGERICCCSADPPTAQEVAAPEGDAMSQA